MGRQRIHTPEARTARSFGELATWPREAIDYLHAAFERKRQGAGPTWSTLLGEIHAAFGLTWNDSALSRYYGYWASTLRIEDQARDEAAAIVERLVSSPSPDLLAAAKQLLQQQRLLALTRLEAADPAEVVRLGLAHDRNEIRSAQIAIDKQRVALLERKLSAYEAKQAAADKQVAALVAAQELTPEVAGKIREMYGLAAEA